MRRSLFLSCALLCLGALGCGGDRDTDMAANDSPRADNTAQNVRDRDESAQTPLDQGESEADIQITTAIRQSVVGNDSLSTNGKNVKIMTNGGVVTLRGPVDTMPEKDLIVRIAQSTPGVVRVNDELEVTVH
jgi:osmotically-inducible protein OsmY